MYDGRIKAKSNCKSVKSVVLMIEMGIVNVRPAPTVTHGAVIDTVSMAGDNTTNNRNTKAAKRLEF